MRIKATESCGVLVRADVGARQHIGRGTLACRSKRCQTILMEGICFFFGAHEVTSLMPKLHSRLSAPGGQLSHNAVDSGLLSLFSGVLRGVYHVLKVLLANPATGGCSKPLRFGKPEDGENVS